MFRLMQAAIIAVFLLGIVAVFQIALALGAPLGRAAWGGRHERVLPTSLRVASALAGVVVYPFIIVLVLASARLLPDGSVPGAGKTAMVVLAGFFAVGTLANLASRSKVERVWSPVSLVIAICCGIIATAL